MKCFLNLLCVILLLTSVLSSCTIEKRVHMSGYYIDWKTGSRVLQKNRLVESRKFQKSPVSIDTKEVNSMDDIAMASVDSTPLIILINEPARVSSASTKAPKEHAMPLPEECDIIILTNGEEIKAKVIEVGTKEIRYIICDNLQGPTYVKNKWDVFMIKYANGTNTVISPQNTQPNNNNVQAPYTGQKQIEILSVISFSMAMLGLALLVVTGFPFLMGTGAIIMGIIGLSKFKKEPGKWSGQGFAIAGIAIGALVILLFWLFIVFLIAVLASFGLWD